MTTVVVVSKANQICIAADTLASYGSQKESAEYIANADKILRVGDSYLAPTGPASAQLVLKSYFKDPDRLARFESIDSIFETMRAMHGVLKDEYFLNPKEDDDQPYESLQMDCLIANPHGIFGVYSLRSIQEYKRFYAFGSGSEYALGAMHALYDSEANAESIALAGVRAAAEFDGSTGLPATSFTTAKN